MPAGKLIASLMALTLLLLTSHSVSADKPKHAHGHVEFTIRSVKSGKWSDPATWQPKRLPGKGDRVLVSRGTEVKYDSRGKAVLRLVQVVGTLRFATDRSTEMNVGLLKVQDSDHCSESGFACDFSGVSKSGEPTVGPTRPLPSLLVGTPADPIPSAHTARIRLHYIAGMNKADAPAIACCSARMEIHGASMSHTWLKLGAHVEAGDKELQLAKPPRGWKAGDQLIVTASERGRGFGSFREGARRYREPQTEQRTIARIEGPTVILDKPLKYRHSGAGEFRSEVANLSRNVIIESADPNGVRGHTVYHRFSRGSISYARFAHLGKAGVLGRYAIHYHLVGSSMRGSYVQGAAIVDSHNRWITIHGTQYLVVRDCVGYKSLGHGFFMEDGTEIYNLLENNLGVHAYRTRRLPNQVLPFDQNDGAAFWWANGRNTLNRNVGVENDQYAFRYDMQHSRYFDARLPILQPDGRKKPVDVRTIPIWRFDDNEAHGNFAGMVVAANGGRQPDAPIRSKQMLDRIKRIDWTGPDSRHPHMIRNLSIWNAHYAIRPHSPNMLIDGLRIHGAAYGIYRPAFENHVYRNLHLSALGPEPFNRGMDDASAQVGSISVDGMIVDDLNGGNDRHPFVHMTDNALAEGAECHFRNIVLKSKKGRRPLFNLGGSVRVDPFVERGVPYYIHDHYGPGRHAKIVSTKAKHLIQDGNKYREERPLTGDESRVAEVQGVSWPKLLDPVDDIPPATIILEVVRDGKQWNIRGVSHDNGDIASITVNQKEVVKTKTRSGVVSWELKLPILKSRRLVAAATDKAGNREATKHVVLVDSLGP